LVAIRKPEARLLSYYLRFWRSNCKPLPRVGLRMITAHWVTKVLQTPSIAS